MPQHHAGGPAAPAQQGLRHQAVEVRLIQFVEDGFQIVGIALRPGDELAPAGLLHQLEAAPHLLTVEIAAVALGVNARRGAAEKLGYQNMGQGFEDGRRSPFQNVGDTNSQARRTPAHGAIRVGEFEKFQTNRGNGGARLQLAKDAREYFLGSLKENGALQHAGSNSFPKTSLALNASGATGGEGADLFQGSHGGVARKGGYQSAVRPAEPESILRRFTGQQPI